MYEIDYKIFDACLDALIKLKEQLFPILYRANIVFQYKENYTPEEMKKMFTDRMINYG